MTGHKLQFLYHIYFEVPILLKQNHTHTNACFDRSAFGIFDVRTSNIVLQLRPDVVTFYDMLFEKLKPVDFQKLFKPVRCRQLIEFMAVCEY